ncbi:tellurite resistance/C4-dicarboxylate transporter family protein [Streptomyces sp. NPDC055243]|uniref:tellurite resistance/C4-dicarboxylate transporter family protein n=1 Tax=Streptomyces sp. NPDC055243 TaxID=3365720 RepID=UPI0037CE4F69
MPSDAASPRSPRSPERPRSPRWTDWADGLPPATGAVVMATAVLSVGLHLLGVEWASLALLVVALVVWLFLAAVFARHLLTERDRWRHEIDTPPALTAVAATAVLGTRLSLLGHQPVSVALLCLSVLLWPLLMSHVIRHWQSRLPGAAYLVCVATQAIVVLAATVATADRLTWLMWPALVLFVIGLVLYAVVLRRFDFGQLVTGRGDHWIIAGAMAISALAGSKLVAASAPHGPLHWATSAHDALRVATLVALGLAFAWYAVLVVCELMRPRPHYDVRRWATVFPLGMTAVAALSTSTAAAVPWLWTCGKVLLWPALAVWTVVAVGALRAAARERSGSPAPAGLSPPR